MVQLPYNQVGEHLEVTIEKMDTTGRAIGWHQDKQVFCKGALPGEKVVIEVVKHKKGYLIGDVIEVKKASPYRITPQEDHFFMCSPWQMIDYDYQCNLKKNLLKESFKDFNIELTSFQSSELIFGYRTKMEYGFMEKNNKLYFSVRGHNSKVPTDKCILASEEMNTVAKKVLQHLRSFDIKEKDLKSLMIRQSKTTGKILVVLYTKVKKDFNLRISNFNKVTGLLVVFSDPARLTSVTTEILFQEGESYLTENIGGVNIQYPYNAFFQNHIPLFNATIQTVRDNLKPSINAVEFYAGAGAIGLALHDKVSSMQAYEVVSDMVEAANSNARRNSIRNYTANTLAAENSTVDILSNTDLLILDPPRKGVDMRLITDILNTKPQQIVYLSCNHVTQARDYEFLKDYYEITHLSGYDYYPNTPHVESLMMLELRS